VELAAFLLSGFHSKDLAEKAKAEFFGFFQIRSSYRYSRMEHSTCCRCLDMQAHGRRRLVASTSEAKRSWLEAAVLKPMVRSLTDSKGEIES